MADDLTSYLPMYTDPRLQAPAPGTQPLYAAGSIPLQNTRAVNGSWSPAVPMPVASQNATPPTALPPATAPAPTPAAAPAQGVADFVSTVKGSRPARGSAMPKTAAAPVVPNQPAQPLVPGETGFYVGWGNDKLVPYGTRLDGQGNILGGAGGAGGGLYDNLPGGGKMVGGRFADPRDALEIGFRLQSQYRDESMKQILALAGSGSELGYRARVAALAQAFGQNNFGSTAVGGTNALNAAIAHVTGSELGAGATLGASENYLTGALANVGERAEENRNNPHQIGAEPMYGPGGIPMGILPTFGTRAGAPAYNAVDTSRPKPTPKEGATGKTPDGRAVVYKNGEWQLSK